jgi:hypothetical protein
LAGHRLPRPLPLALLLSPLRLSPVCVTWWGARGNGNGGVTLCGRNINNNNNDDDDDTKTMRRRP